MKTLYGNLLLTESNVVVGTGWLPPKPDLRDYTDNHKEIKNMVKKLGTVKDEKKLPASIDLREWCSPVENQLTLGSCTAHAGVGLIEYFEKRAFDRYIEGSRLFLYKVTRNLMQTAGDSGAWLRDVMKALAHCGVPDEKYWPYNIGDFDKEPDAFVYSLADNYEVLKYFCHDPQGLHTPSRKVLSSVKKYLASGIPSMFGFWGFSSYDKSDVKGGIPYPCPGESAEWGHAVIAVGYDDEIKIKNLKCNKETEGAIMIRNSWGSSWGDKGYGWLPYDYILNDLALDFWSILNMRWINSEQFGMR
ncbi:MAG TPA: C1 family peptidase [Bacteroidales bacterium]|nr:C1 family peptidase [Bacteroidales bacterium]